MSGPLSNLPCSRPPYLSRLSLAEMFPPPPRSIPPQKLQIPYLLFFLSIKVGTLILSCYVFIRSLCTCKGDDSWARSLPRLHALCPRQAANRRPYGGHELDYLPFLAVFLFSQFVIPVKAGIRVPRLLLNPRLTPACRQAGMTTNAVS